MSDHLIWKNPAPDASAPREPTLSVETAAALRDDRLARALASERRVDELNARIRLLEQQLKTAREALEPFAYIGEKKIKPDWDDDAPVPERILNEGTCIEDFRRAAAAIRSLGEKE